MLEARGHCMAQWNAEESRLRKEAQNSKEAHSQGEVSPSNKDNIEQISKIYNGRYNGKDLS